MLLNVLTEDFEPIIMARESSSVKISNDYVRSTLLQKDYNINNGKDKRGEDSTLLKREISMFEM